MLIWGATAILLAVAVVAGYAALEGLSDRALAWPLGFAAGAVLASLADTLMPEAFKEADQYKKGAYFTALGFLLSLPDLRRLEPGLSSVAEVDLRAPVGRGRGADASRGPEGRTAPARWIGGQRGCLRSPDRPDRVRTVAPPAPRD